MMCVAQLRLQKPQLWCVKDEEGHVDVVEKDVMTVKNVVTRKKAIKVWVQGSRKLVSVVSRILDNHCLVGQSYLS